MAFSLKAVLGMDATPFERGMKRMRRSVNKFSNRLAKMGLAAASAAFLVFSRNAIKAANEVGRAADRLGLTTDAFQNFINAAKASDIKTRAAEMGLQRFTRRLGEAQRGGGELLGTLKEYNIALRDSTGNARSADAVLGDLANAIQGAESPAERLRIAFKAFDSEGADLVRILKDGEEGFKAFAETGNEEFGRFEEGTIKALSRADKEIRAFKSKATIKVGELIAMEEGGAAFKILGLQLGKVASNFSTDLLHAIIEAGKTGGIAILEGIRAPFSKHDFDTLFANALDQLPENQNSMLKRLGKTNAAWYDDQIAKQKAKLEKARAESDQDKPGGAFGGRGSGGGGASAVSGDNKIREYRLKLLKAEAEGNNKVAESMRRRIDFIQRVLKVERETNATREEAIEIAKKQIMSEQGEGGASGASGGPEFGRELKMSEAVDLAEGDRKKGRSLVVRSRLEAEAAGIKAKAEELPSKGGKGALGEDKQEKIMQIAKDVHSIAKELTRQT